MAELKRTDEEFRAVGLATSGIPPKQPERPKLVKRPEAETPDRGVAVSQSTALFSEPEMGDFRSQWIRGRATPGRRERRQAGSCSDAATRGRLCQRAVRIGKAVGQR